MQDLKCKKSPPRQAGCYNLLLESQDQFSRYLIKVRIFETYTLNFLLRQVGISFTGTLGNTETVFRRAVNQVCGSGEVISNILVLFDHFQCV